MYDPSVDDIDVIAVDPGKTVGVAYLTIHGGHVSWQAAVEDAVPALWHALRMWYGPNSESKPRLVVVERFQITPETIKKTRQYDALEVIGALRYGCMRMDVPFELQDKMMSFRIGNAQRLKAVGWYRPGKEHANVASGHLAAALVTRHRKLFPSVSTAILAAGTINA